MAKKVIQVPIDEELLEDLNRQSKKMRQARAELIRQACQRYLKQMEQEELERLYKQGYENIPEEPETGEAQASLAGEVMTKESW